MPTAHSSAVFDFEVLFLTAQAIPDTWSSCLSLQVVGITGATISLVLGLLFYTSWCLWFFWGRIFCSSGWHQSCYVANWLALNSILLPLCLKVQNCRHWTSCCMHNLRALQPLNQNAACFQDFTYLYSLELNDSPSSTGISVSSYMHLFHAF